VTEEPITTYKAPNGQATVIVTDRARRGGSGWVIGVMLLIAVIVGTFIFSQMSGPEIAKDDAVAAAANEVGNAANKVGEAAQQAGTAARDAAQNTVSK